MQAKDQVSWISAVMILLLTSINQGLRVDPGFLKGGPGNFLAIYHLNRPILRFLKKYSKFINTNSWLQKWGPDPLDMPLLTLVEADLMSWRNVRSIYIKPLALDSWAH